MNDAQKVDEYMAKLEHPFKAEIEALRTIIKNANTKLAERIKWNAPSYYYQKDMAAFNPRAKGYVQIIFVFYNGSMIDNPILQGVWKDRREARFYNLEDIETKKEALENVVNEWVGLIDLH